MVFLKPNGTELGSFFSFSVGLMVEQCLGERKPHQGETNRSGSFEAVHIVGHFRETVFSNLVWSWKCHFCGFFNYDLNITCM